MCGMKKILIIVGHTGAGKSTICRYLANLYNASLISFADVGKNFSNDLGYKRIRECYKDIGTTKFKELFSDFFFIKITETLTKCDFLIVDGLYLDDIFSKLKLVYSTLAIYIDVPESVCKMRIANRMGISIGNIDGEYDLKEEMKEKLGNGYVINHADIVVDGKMKKDVICKEIEKLDFLSDIILNTIHDEM